MDDKLWEEVLSGSPVAEMQRNIDEMEKSLTNGSDADRLALSQCWLTLASYMEEEEDEPEGIIDVYAKALDIVTQIADKSDDPEVWDMCGSAYLMNAIFLTEQDKLDEGIKQYGLARERFTRATQMGRESCRFDVAGVDLNVANILRCRDQFQEACDLVRGARETFEAARPFLKDGKADENDLERVFYLAKSQSFLADLSYALYTGQNGSDLDGILASALDAVELYRGLADRLGDDFEHEEDYAIALLVAADVCEECGRIEDADQFSSEAYHLIKKLREEDLDEDGLSDYDEFFFEAAARCLQRLYFSHPEGHPDLESIIQSIEEIPGLEEFGSEEDDIGLITIFKEYTFFMGKYFPGISSVEKRA